MTAFIVKTLVNVFTAPVSARTTTVAIAALVGKNWRMVMNKHDKDEHDASCNGISPCDMATDLDQLLEDVSVHGPGQWENSHGPKGWFAVSTEDAGGIVAYFSEGSHAYAFRLALINAMLNPLV